MPSTVVAPVATSDSNRRAGWNGPVRWQREVQHAASVADPKCAFRKQSLDRLGETIRPTLTRLIQQVAIPALAERYGIESPRTDCTRAFDPELAYRLATLVLDGAAASPSELLSNLIGDGVPVEVILLDLMCEAEALVDDRLARAECTALDATAAVCQLRMLALELAHDQRPDTDVPPRWACVMAMPGDSLRFAPILHECFLRMAGWSVEKLEGLSPATMRSRMWERVPDLVLAVLNERRLLATATDTLGRLKVGYAPGEGPLFVGIGAGFAGCERWPCQVELDAITAEPVDTLQLVSSGGYCDT